MPALLGSYVAFVGRLISAQTQLINSLLRTGSGITRPAPAAEAVELRAYEIYQQRAGGPGDPVGDWRQAEAELRGEKNG